MTLVIVESPAKAKTINKYLGPDFEVVASFGHVRDLPPKDGSVDPDADFSMIWQVQADSKKRMTELAKAAKAHDRLVLATDPDREGEAISWHVLEVLNEKKALKDTKVERVTFNEITKAAVQKAMQSPREIDQRMVDAYLARRALDYLVGFNLSPVLWRKLPGSRSAGRVQSVALRLICDRELEIETFKPEEYWTIEAACQNEAGQSFAARLFALDGKKLGKFALPNADVAHAAKARIEAQDFSVSAVEAKPAKRHPYPPFTTSTLQQEAARKLGFNASRTMQVAQKLYEGVPINGETQGLITYMRTDGVSMAGEAIAAARRVIGEDHGEAYVPDVPRAYKSKAKNAQEAHEAVRPVDLELRPHMARKYLSDEQARLYELVWKRALASQMESARLERTTVTLTAKSDEIELRATGQVLQFDGFLALYQEGRDDADDEENGARLPALKNGEAVPTGEVKAEQHFTQPPPRFTEASLVKRLEELGIGRPSTYASTLSTLRDRDYVHMEQNRFIPEDKGRLVIAFLESFFARYVEYDFTAGLEEQLDQVSAGEMEWRDLLRAFWKDFTGAIDDISDLRVSHVLDALNEMLGPHVFPPREDGSDPRSCPVCADGVLSLKVGRFGAFVGCSNYPDCNFTRPFSGDDKEAAAAASNDGKELGTDPDTGLPLTLKTGRFGPYIERPPVDEGEKPKRAGIPKDVPVDELDFDMALKLIRLPREIGTHPETQKMIEAAIGRYGPYLKHEGKYARLGSTAEVFEIGLNRAVTLLAEAKSSGGRRQAATPKKVLGEHPSGEQVGVFEGRYGPYVKAGQINATIPKERQPDEITLEEAIALIDARSEKTGKPVKKGARKTAAKKKTAKKTTKKAAKKTTKKAAKKTTKKAAKKTAKKAAPKKAAASDQ